MAKSLAAGNGHMESNSTPTKEEFEKFLARYKACDDAVAEAVGERKDLRAVIKGAGGKGFLRAFDRARRDADRSGAERIEEDEHYRRMMEWQNRPLGYQAGFDMTDAPPPARFQLPEKEMQRVDDHGYTTGKAGHPAARNPWNPGTEPYDHWLAAWTRGQGDKVGSEIKRGPGRPKGSGKAKDVAPAAAPKAKRGRKPKTNGADPVVPVGEVAPPNEEARRLGYENGLAGNRDNAARFPEGQYGAGDYALGYADGSREREEKGDPLPLTAQEAQA